MERTSVKPSISVIVPVYNSETTLEPLCHELTQVLNEVSSKFEIFLVNDGSSDNSWKCIQRIQAQNSAVSGINLMRNYGQHNATLAGIRQAKGEILVTIDDDLEYGPKEIPRLLAKLEEGHDVVYGTPIRQDYSFTRRTASQLAKYILTVAFGLRLASVISSYRLFRSELREAFANQTGPFICIDALLTWGTTRFASIEIDHQFRKNGKSNYTFFKLLTHTLNLMTSFSTLPLQIASALGFFFTVFGFGVLAFVLIFYAVAGRAVHGFTFLASIISLFGGIQLFALGIVGEYLTRMHFRVLNKPPYILREVSENTKSGKGKKSKSPKLRIAA